MNDDAATAAAGNAELRAPGQRSWASALSRLAEPYRGALSDALRRSARSGGAQDLEEQLLQGGAALSLITYAACLPLHLLTPAEQPAACEQLASLDFFSLGASLHARLQTAQRILLIGDEPSRAAMAQAIDQARQSAPVGSLIAGPGNLLEPVLRDWANDAGWPSLYVRSLDGSAGDLWHSTTGENLEVRVKQLFDIHRPTAVVLLEPVRLPATQACIEQAAIRKVPMTVVEAPNIHRAAAKSAAP